MATYRGWVKDTLSTTYWDSLQLAEHHIYGSARVGIALPNVKRYPTIPENSYISDSVLYYLPEGWKRYELTNHLGNVLAVITDRKRGLAASGTDIQWYEADVMATQQYYPFGMLMPTSTDSSLRRQYSLNEYDYRYGFNGKEGDDEIKGDDNQQDYGMRIYDPRVGRFLSVDPLSGKNTSLSPYSTFANNPIIFTDPDGQDNFLYLVFLNKGGTELTSTQKDAITNYAQWLITHHGLNVKVKLIDFNSSSPIDASLLDNTDRLVYIGAASEINKLQIPGNEEGEILELQEEGSHFGTQANGQTAAVNLDKYHLKTFSKNDFKFYHGVSTEGQKLNRDEELSTLKKKYGGPIDYVAHTVRTILHEWGHTIVGNGHPDEPGGNERYNGDNEDGVGIMSSGNTPKVPFPRELYPKILRFHTVDREKFWEYFNTRGWDDKSKKWIPAPKPKDNFSKKYEKVKN